MTRQNIVLIGAPIDCGKRRRGCIMGPDALRTAGLAQALMDLDLSLADLGNVTPDTDDMADDGHLHAPAAVASWTDALSRAAEAAMDKGIAIFLGGDHAMSLGTIRGVAAHAARQERPLFVLWLDAHTDYHTPRTTESGNLHGTPIGYLTGRAGFDRFPDIQYPIPHENICMLGLRSVDAEERAALAETDVMSVDMRAIDEAGIAAPLKQFLDRVRQANGFLHVSFDVDFLDPGIAPAVGTTVPGGATLREAHLAMEIIHDSGLMRSMDIAELNPFLDERGRTATTLVDLVASALGRKVFDRPTQAFWGTRR